MFTPETGPDFCPDLQKPPTLEYIVTQSSFEQQRYPFRRASEADLAALVALRETCSRWIGDKEGTNGMWEHDWPNPELARASRLANIQAGNVYVVEDTAGDICASITVKEEGNETLWDDAATEPALYISSLMKRPDIAEPLGKELLWWACEQACQRGKVWVRLDVWDDNEALQAYYREACGFQQLPSKIWANYPSSARFQLCTNQYDVLANPPSRKRLATPGDILAAEEPFQVAYSLNSFVLSEWRYGAYGNNALLGSLTNGQLSLPEEPRPRYETHGHAVGLPLDIGTAIKNEQLSVEALVAVAESMGAQAGKAFIEILLQQDFYGANDPFLVDTQNMPQGPINIYDMLDRQTQTALMGTMGLARFLARIQRSAAMQSPVAERGRQHVLSRGSQAFGWHVVFSDIERPATTAASYQHALRYYKGARYAGPGILVKGILADGALELDDVQVPLQPQLGGPQGSARPGAEEVVVQKWLRPPTADEFGFQPYEPKQGDTYMARLSVAPTGPGEVAHMQATLLRVDQ